MQKKTTVETVSKIKTTFGKVLSFLYSGVDASADAVGTGSSILVIANTASKVTPVSTTAAYLCGVITGGIIFTTNHFFQGTIIRKNWSSDSNHQRIEDSDSDSEDESLLYEHPLDITFRKKCLFLLSKYGYSITACLVNFLQVCLLYSATKAWVQDVQTGEETPLDFISLAEVFALLGYYFGFDFVFSLFAEIIQSTKELRKSFNISPHQAPDLEFLSRLQKLITPLARNNAYRKFVRVTGSMCDTLEHVIPLAIVVPAEWIRYLWAQSLSYSIPAFGAGGLTLALTAGIIFTQTYLFEGKFCEDNLKLVAEETGQRLPHDEPWFPAKLSNIFFYLLLAGGLVHGIDAGFSWLLTLEEWGLGDATAYTIAAVAFLIAWAGNHFSEVKESQESLKKITIKSESTNGALINNSSWFKQPRKKMEEELTYESEPYLLYDYVTKNYGSQHQ